jgi:hypothetical protein
MNKHTQIAKSNASSCVEEKVMGLHKVRTIEIRKNIVTRKSKNLNNEDIIFVIL